ncbi:right-handed parallel beta-helix repeat-containing protein [Natronococcus sp.]|uniref:right-handed parallel beta-helix repeat-containing protein n=1 Tax=Natronococcus sp. TaxID=35747 RepID=UPI003A4DEF40
MVHETDSSRDRSRRAVIGAVGATGLGLVGSTSVGASSDGDPTPIDSPTVIEEPGEYELVADLEPEELDQRGCIVVNLQDEHGEFTLYGNGHTIDLGNITSGSFDPGRIDPSCITLNRPPRNSPWGPNRSVDWDTTIENVELRGGYCGIFSRIGGGGRFSEITATENENGLWFASDTGRLRDCTITENYRGVYVQASVQDWGRRSEIDVENCTVEANGTWYPSPGRDKGHGIWVSHQSDAQIGSSRIVGNGNGIQVSAWDANAVIEGNHICYNDQYGIEGQLYLADDDERESPRQPRVQATGNYWGTANGPSSRLSQNYRHGRGVRRELIEPDEPFTDPETGRPADGDGDAISESLESGVTNVYFDPFSETPLEDVGDRR